MAMKALTEYPEQAIVFVSTRKYDTHLMELLQLYPWFQGRYQFSLLADVNENPFPSGAFGLYPIYFAVDTSTAEALARKLPAYYRKVLDQDPANAFRVWLLIPGETPSSNDQSPDAGPLRLQFVREIQFKRTSDPLGIQPIDVAVDTGGNIYIATNRDGLIRKYNPEGKPLLSWGNTDSNRKVFVDLFGIAIGPDNLVYAIDAGTSTLHRFTTSGDQAGTPIPGVGYATRGIGIDPAGNLLVADTGSGRIARYSPEGALIEHFHRNGKRPGEFHEPIDVAVNSDGEWFVMDAGNRRIQKLDREGSFIESWEIPSEVTARDGGHLALDSKGRLFVTRPITIEAGDLVVYDTRGKKIARLFEPQLTAPTGVFVDASDYLYVTYPRSDVVRIYRIR
jgi:DNA-binding beta-propeller fold protein YncE